MESVPKEFRQRMDGFGKLLMADRLSHPCLLARQVDQFDRLERSANTSPMPLPPCAAGESVSSYRAHSGSFQASWQGAEDRSRLLSSLLNYRFCHTRWQGREGFEKPSYSHTRTRLTLGLSLFCALVSLGAQQSARAASPAETLASAVAEYQAGMSETGRSKRIEHFHRAELLFSRLTGGTESNPTGIRNPELFFNQGNAALQAQRIGPAILAYRRALLIDPAHAHAQQNLAEARGVLPVWARKTDDEQLFNTFFGWLTKLSIDQRLFYAGLCFFAVMLLVAASIRWRNAVLRNVALIPVIVWLVMFGSAVFSMLNGTSDEAIVTVPEVVARSADSANAPARFREPLPSGTEVQILEDRADWLQVKLPNGRDAWLPSSSVTRIALDESTATAR